MAWWLVKVKEKGSPWNFVRWYNYVRDHCTGLIDDSASNRWERLGHNFLLWFCAVYSTETVWLVVEGPLPCQVEFVDLCTGPSCLNQSIIIVSRNLY